MQSIALVSLRGLFIFTAECPSLSICMADREVGCHDRWHFHEGGYVMTDSYELFLLQ